MHNGLFMKCIKAHDSRYPSLLKRLEKPPEALYIEGDESLLLRPYLSVVGARDAGLWVREWLEYELSPVLKELGVGVVSGGARGVDQWAHWLCLRGKVPTLIVLPSGCRNKYPRTLSEFEGRSEVLFISEYEPETVMRKHFFYKRNRLIAGLSPLTLIVQAQERSGTMITAKYAMDVGSCVGALPGAVMDVSMAGNNQLIFDGASMVRDRHDLRTLLSQLI